MSPVPFLSVLFDATFCGHFLGTPLVETFCWHFLWTLIIIFLSTTPLKKTIWTNKRRRKNYINKKNSVHFCVFWYWCYDPHRSRDSVSAVCGILLSSKLLWNLFVSLRFFFLLLICGRIIIFSFSFFFFKTIMFSPKSY